MSIAIIGIKKGKRLSKIKFKVWQTPEEVTKRILNAESPLKEYEEWVFENAEDIEVPIYALDDYYHEREPIGYQIVNTGELHMNELRKRIKKAFDRGYEIKVVEDK